MFELFYCGIGIGYQDIFHKEISAYKQVLNTEIGKTPLLEAMCGAFVTFVPLKMEIGLKNSSGYTQYDGYLMNGTPYRSQSKNEFTEIVLTPTLELTSGFDIRHQISIGKWERDLTDYIEEYSTTKFATGLGWHSRSSYGYEIDVFLGTGHTKTKLVVDNFNFNSLLKEGQSFDCFNLRLGYQQFWVSIEHEKWGTLRTKQGIMVSPETKSKRANVLIGKRWLF